MNAPMDLDHYYRRMRNQAQADADKWREMALRYKHDGDTWLAVLAARHHRRCAAEARRYKEKVG